MAKIHATRAIALVGTPFRPQGRNPSHGLDCIGLCLIAYGLPVSMARDDYRLRGDHRDEIETAILTNFRRVGHARPRPGDLLLMLPAADQPHLGILTVGGFVHADARLRHVVETPGAPSWPVAGTYRLGAGRRG
ncbi:MAG: C40 family peptidase [Pseudomonadota bacterium]|nr:C40 family peptidase [Pseudomonadota bacterium]